MTNSKRIIRDFLYVDLDRLYSLYSQVFHGVASQMVESFTSQATSTESGKAHPFSGRTLEDQVGELSTRTQVKWLHDHLYSTLEEKLRDVTLESSKLGPENYQQILSDCFLLKVEGTAEIGDYQRLRSMLDKFNALGEAITYARLRGASSTVSISISEQRIASLKDRNAKTTAREFAKKQTDPKSMAKAMGLYQEPQLLNGLKLFLDFFGMDPFEIVISTADQPCVAFRGVIDRKWLRMDPGILRSLYGTSLEGPVTMVGQVTHFPRPTPVSTIPESQPPFRQPSEMNPSMRDAYQGMFKAGRALEHMFLESDSRIEVVVCPLAIYRQQEIQI